MSDNSKFWSVINFLFVACILGIAGITRGCVMQDRELENKEREKAVEDGCIYIDGCSGNNHIVCK